MVRMNCPTSEIPRLRTMRGGAKGRGGVDPEMDILERPPRRSAPLILGTAVGAVYDRARSGTALMLSLEKCAVTEGVIEWAGKQNSPPQQRRGGAKRRGGVGQLINFLIEPPRRFAAPLLCQGGEFALFQFIHTMTDRAYIKTRAACGWTLRLPAGGESPQTCLLPPHPREYSHRDSGID